MHLAAESDFMNLYQNTVRGKISIRLINAEKKNKFQATRQGRAA